MANAPKDEHACIQTEAVLLPSVSDSYKCPDLLFVPPPCVRLSVGSRRANVKRNLNNDAANGPGDL